MGLERAASVAQALALAPTLGIPHQNFVIGDRTGHIAWTIGGRIPADIPARRANGHSDLDDSRDASTHRRSRRSAESGPPTRAPRTIRRNWPPSAVIDASVGADYDLPPGPARSVMICWRCKDRRRRRTCCASNSTTGPFPDSMARFPHRSAGCRRRLRDHPERGPSSRSWSRIGTRAPALDSVGYRLVRGYHERLERSVWEMMLRAPATRSDEKAWAPFTVRGGAVADRERQPLHMLDANYADWRQFLLGAGGCHHRGSAS